MIDIWNYANPGEHLRITTVTGQVFEGWTIMVWDVEEQMGSGTEDMIDLDLTDGRIMGFYPSEISKIEVLS